MYQPSRTHHLSPSSSGQHHITGHPSPHRRTHLDNLFSLFHRNNYNTHDAPPRASFFEWARTVFVHLPRGRNDEGVELQERRLAVVNVPFTRGKPVSLSFFHLKHSTPMESRRGTTQWENYGGRKRKKNRKQCERRKQRTHRTRMTLRTLLQATPFFPRAASYSNPVERLKLHKFMLLSPLCPLHRPLLLLPRRQRRRPRPPRQRYHGLDAGPASGYLSVVCLLNILTINTTFPFFTNESILSLICSANTCYVLRD